MTDQEQGLKRELTARQMAMVAVGGSIGTGLLLGSGAAIQVAGPAVVLTFVLSALISWTVAMALGEMSAVHPAAGSFGVYADLYLNRWAGFIARYGYWFAVVIVVGSEVVAAATYMRQWYPAVPQIVWMVTFGLFLLAINFFSVGHYGTFEYWFALLKVVTIFVFIVMGAALLFSGKVQPQYVASGGFAPQGWSAPLMAISFGLYSFLGIEMVAISSGEARSRKDVARATRIAFATLVLVYVGAMAVLVGVMPWKNAGVSESPFVTVFKVAGIPAAGFIMNFVVLSAALSGANASLYVASRMLFALARSGYAPQRMGVLNQHGVPMGAVLASMAGIVGAILLQLRTSNAYLYIINAALGWRNDCVAGFAAGACPLPANSLRRSTGRGRSALPAGRRRLDSGIHRDCGRDCLHMVGIAVERCRQERRDLSGGADGGVLAGEEEVGLLLKFRAQRGIPME